MADFCTQCSIELFSEDFGDLKGLLKEEKTQKGLVVRCICEGCGFIEVDHTGKCVAKYCEMHGDKK
jgi:hypothetical protein